MPKNRYIEVNGRNISGEVDRKAAKRAAKDYKRNHPRSVVKVRRGKTTSPRYPSGSYAYKVHRASESGHSGFGW